MGDDDIFQALNDDDIAVDQDINDIFRWTESPPQSPGASPRRDSISQPGSPSCGMSGRHSPFHAGGPNRVRKFYMLKFIVSIKLQTT